MSRDGSSEAKTKEVNDIFLIGAGFTRAVFQDAPLNADLVPFVVRDNPKTLLTKYRIRYHTEDIEILLTRMDLEMEELQSEQLRRDRETIKQDLAKYFERFRFRAQILENNRWLEDFAKNVFQPNDAIITTNYDCFLEGLLDLYKIWHPHEGYVNVYDPRIPTNSPETILKNPKGIKFYKIHGSENFSEFKVFDNGETGQTALGFNINKSVFPESGKNSHIRWLEINKYIISPSFVKKHHHNIERIMVESVHIAPKAKKMIIIGSGLRPEDSFLWLLLSSFIEPCVPNRPKKKLIIVDPKAEEIKSKTVKHYIWDLDSLLDIKPLSECLECVVEDLIKLSENRTS